jgi:tRNA(Ile)-lysidine synthetase-like protein
VTREEAAAYARSRGADPVEDPTNARPELQRTRARALLARSTGLRDALVALGARASDLAAEIARRAEALGPLDRLDAAAVAALDRHVAAALLRRAGLHRAGRAHARALLALAADRAGTRSIDLGSGLVAERRYQILRIGERTEAEPWEEIAPAGPGTYRLGPWLVELDGAGTGEELVLRFPRPGDFARTWSGRRKLSDLLIDAKVARPERARIALAARGAEVVAIAHPALSRRLADSPSPRQAIRFSRITVGETGPEWRLTPG